MAGWCRCAEILDKLAHEQEILMNLQMCVSMHTWRSAILRVEKLVSIKGEEACKVQIDMARVFERCFG